MQYTFPKNFIAPEAQIALEYSHRFFLSQPYTKDRRTKFPIMYRLQEAGELVKRSDYAAFRDEFSGRYPQPAVYRANHGLCHTAGTMMHLHYVVDFNLRYAVGHIKNYIRTKLRLDRNFIVKLQIAMAFYVAGRDGEFGFDQKADYERCRAQSKQAFLNYVQRYELIPEVFSSIPEVLRYADCLKSSYILDTENINDQRNTETLALRALMYGCHAADLPRIWSDHKLQTDTVYDLMKVVARARREEAKPAALKIFDQAKCWHSAVGASNAITFSHCGSKDQVSCCQDEEKFFAHETNLQKCLEQAQEIYAEPKPDEAQKPAPEAMVQNLIAQAIKGIRAYQERQRRGCGTHLSWFSQLFDERRGRHRAEFYAQLLQSGELEIKHKLLILYSLLASADGKTLQQDVKYFLQAKDLAALREDVRKKIGTYYGPKQIEQLRSCKVIGKIVTAANTLQTYQINELKELLNVQESCKNRL